MSESPAVNNIQSALAEAERELGRRLVTSEALRLAAELVADNIECASQQRWNSESHREDAIRNIMDGLKEGNAAIKELQYIAIHHIGTTYPVPAGEPPLYIQNRSVMGDYEDKVRELQTKLAAKEKIEARVERVKAWMQHSIDTADRPFTHDVQEWVRLLSGDKRPGHPMPPPIKERAP